MNEEFKKHWEDIYTHKNPDDVSWTQNQLGVCASFFEQTQLSIEANLIDVGSGRKGMIEYWLDSGYEQITALDLSGMALNKMRADLLEQDRGKITFKEEDILKFTSEDLFDYWNDRAVFHFLTQKEDQQRYLKQVTQMVRGYICIGTFSNLGPLKCSGLPITQYSQEDLVSLFEANFELLESKQETHQTPFGTQQEFVFCLFKRK